MVRSQGVEIESGQCPPFPNSLETVEKGVVSHKRILAGVKEKGKKTQ